MKELVSTINKYIFSLLMIFLSVGFLINELVNSYIVQNLLSLTILVFIMLTLPQLRGMIAIITYTMILVGILLLINIDYTFEMFLQGARTNLALATILILIPLLGIPIQTGNYIQSLKIFLKKINSNVKLFYLNTSLITHLLAFVLNMGAITINYYLTKTANIRSTRIIANALNRAYTASIFWSPYFGAMAVILSQLPVSWGEIAPILCGYAVFSIFIGFLLEWPFIKKEQQYIFNDSEEMLDYSNNEIILSRKKVRGLFFLLILMISSVLLLERFTTFSMLFSISTVAIVYPIIWCLIKKEFKSYQKAGLNHLFRDLPRLKQELTMFLTAGLFSSIYIQSPINNVFVEILKHLSFSSIIITLAIVFSIIFTAIIGIHPFIIVTIYVIGIEASQLGLTTEYFAITLLVGLGLSNSLSPATAANNILANSLNIKITTLSIKWNWLYVIVMAFLFPIYLLVLGV